MNKRYTLAEFISGSSQDKADQAQPYLSDKAVDTDIARWHQEIHPVLRDLAKNRMVPEQGLIVEFGAYQGASLKVLNELFGTERVLGYDIYAYTNSPQIKIGDIRKMDLPKQPVALAWNDLSNWARSPRSKLAAFEWSKKYLMPDGLYIEDAWDFIPEDLDLTDFETILQGKCLTVFRKKSR